MTGITQQVLRPRGPQIERLTGNRAKVVIEPLERGYGHTLGNALRRVLLSSIPGFAITEVEIDGVLHEYSTIEGMQEDVLEVLLNLKDVAIRIHSGDSSTLSLAKQGPGVVTAGDIKTDHNVEILNPELVSCNLTKDTALNMRLKIERGFGYQPAAARRRPDEETRAIGRLVLDASFSPVRRVAYAVESARVEQRTDLDKLVLDIETNGTIDAEEAVRTAADILTDQLSVFGDFTHRDRGAAKPAATGVDPILLRPIDDLEIRSTLDPTTSHLPLSILSISSGLLSLWPAPRRKKLPLLFANRRLLPAPRAECPSRTPSRVRRLVPRSRRNSPSPVGRPREWLRRVEKSRLRSGRLRPSQRPVLSRPPLQPRSRPKSSLPRSSRR